MRNKKAQIQINPASEDGYRWIENIGTAWRRTGFADDIARSIQHRGWYTDETFLDQTFRGVVYQLPSRKGKPVYFVGYQDPNNDDAARGEIRTDLDDDNEAAHAADDVARVCAESEREYQAAWQLGRQYADTFDDVNRERRTRKALFADLRKVDLNDAPAICKTLKDKIRSTRRNIKAALQERRDIIEKHWLDKDQLGAFADAAGLSIEDTKALF